MLALRETSKQNSLGDFGLLDPVVHELQSQQEILGTQLAFPTNAHNLAIGSCSKIASACAWADTCIQVASTYDCNLLEYSGCIELTDTD